MKATLARETHCAECGTAIESDIGCALCLFRGALEMSGADNDAVPARLGIYEIAPREDGTPWELGRGSMGVTYRATDTSLQRPVALKLIRSDVIAGKPETRERFMREARAAAALRNAHVAQVYHFGICEETGRWFYAMELVEGETLGHRLARSGPLPVAEVLEIARQITDALGAAQAKGLVHRDLKPENIMLAADGNVKVIDFGVAKAITDEPDPRTLTTGFVGTPAFASPEQIRHDAVDTRADVYSLGATLWFLLTGKLPFENPSAARGAPPLAQLKAARVARSPSALLVSMLAPEPSARPSVPELAARLDYARTQIARRRNLPAKVLLASALIIALGAVAVWSFSRKTSLAETAKKGIAVLPFTDGSADNSSFADGIHDDVLASLSKISALKVISHNSVMQYRGVSRDLREIGQALDVNAILEGNVSRDKSRAHINVQLIKAADGSQIWADSFDRELNDVFAIQSEVALKTASALRAHLSSLETAELQKRPTKNNEAYLRFVEAKNLYGDYRKAQADLDKGERLYQEAIALDPSFALAYARLSQLENVYFEMYDRTSERREKARAAARESLRLQPDLPEGHLALGTDYWRGNAETGEIDSGKALAEFALAERGLPNSAEVAECIGRVERHTGEWDQSIAHARRAVALDPNSLEPWHRLFAVNELTRHYTAAADALEHVIALAPRGDRWRYEMHRSYLNFLWKTDLGELARIPPPPAGVSRSDMEGMIGIKVMLRQFDKAVALAQTLPASTLAPQKLNTPPSDLVLARVYFYQGATEQARAAFDKARVVIEAAARPRDAAFRAALAETYAHLGRKAEAIAEARRGAEIVSEIKDAFFGPELQIDLAQIYVLTGEFDQALPILAHSLIIPAGISVAELRFNPVWDSIRHDPRFEKLIAFESKSTEQAPGKIGIR